MTLAVGAAARAATPSGFPMPGVRPQGMGGAFVAVADDINAIAQNPAGLALIKDRQVMVSHTDLYGLGIDFNYLAFAQKQYGASWAHIDSGSFLMGGSTGGGSFTQDMYTLSASYNVQPQLYAGVSLKILRQSYSPPSVLTPLSTGANPLTETLGSDGYSFDLGALYVVDSATTVGISARDLLGSMKTSNAAFTYGKDRFSPDVNLGFARHSKDSIFAAQVSRVGGESVVRLGMEKKIQNTLTLRAGLDDDVFTAGLGFRQREWQFDYSYKNSSNMGLDKTSRFGAVVHF